MKFLFTLLQTDFSSELNTILSSYVKPILIILTILASLKGAINAVEMIMDRDERGTTKDGFIKLAIIIAAIALVIIVINVVISKLQGVTLSI